jgi:hypothetical protein
MIRAARTNRRPARDLGPPDVRTSPFVARLGRTDRRQQSLLILALSGQAERKDAQ